MCLFFLFTQGEYAAKITSEVGQPKEISCMTMTTQQQTSILQLSQVMFNATPGAIFLDAIGAQMLDGKSFADLAQFFSETNLFFGHIYNDDFPSSFANNFVDDLVGDHTSTDNKTWARNYIIDKMATGATQAGLVAELTQALSAIPSSDPNWGEASIHYNTRIAVKVLFRLAGNAITADDAALAVNYILTQIAAGQGLGTIVEWAITALDGVDHSDPVWGNAAALFDNRIEVSRYYSVDKIGAATSPFTLQYILLQMEIGETFGAMIWRTITLYNPDSAQSSIALRSILAGVTEDVSTVMTAKAAIDDFLKGNINIHGLNGSNGFRLSDGTMLDFSHYRVSSAGDFNHDGYDDVIIGADYFDPSNLPSDASYIVFGKSSGFGATLDLSNLDGSNGFRLDGIAEISSEGFSISNAGDVNADGFGDLIIGTSLHQSGNGYSGSAYVIFGKAAGFNAALDLSNLDENSGFRMDGVVVGEDPKDFVSSAGDFNGDGYDDLIIGSPVADSSYLVFGKASGFDTVLDLTTLDGSKGFRLDAIASGDSVSTAGDMNGDGFDDLMIGANYASPNGSRSGSSYVVFGTSFAFNAPLDLSSLDGSNGFRLDGAAERDSAGYSISNAGDINGDGFDDVIVGARDANPNGENFGSSYVVFGKASGFNDVLDLSSLDGDNGFRLDGTGFSVSSIGDFNGDGFDDLILGAPSADPDGFRVGVSYVVFGKASDFDATLTLSSLDGSNGLILKGLQPGDGLGSYISGAGDVNGDGFDDLIMGISEYVLNHLILDPASSYVVFGGNFTHAVTFLGTPGADILAAGTPKAESFLAGDGNDWMVGGGGLDVFHGGAGDDMIEIPKFGFRLVDGGAGNDTLALTGSGLTLDLVNARGKIDGIEIIDLSGSGNNTLSVNLLDLLNLSDTSNTLKVDGNAGDAITGLDNDWIDSGISGDYHTYVHDAAILLVGINVTTDFV